MLDTKKIIWVVNCVNRKTLKPAREMAISSYSPNPKVRAKKWITRISNPQSTLINAFDLYAGEGWSVVKNTISGLNEIEIEIELWIVSAGYGLIRSDSLIESYNATFERADRNYVGTGNKAKDNREFDRIWWSELNEWKGPTKASNRSFASLIKNNPESPIVISLSRKYFSAVSNDLEEAVNSSQKQNQIFLLTSGELTKPFENIHIPIHARYTQELGGKPFSINFLTASTIINSYGQHNFSFKDVRQMVAESLETLPDLTPYNRKKLTDNEILEMINLLKKRSISHSFTSLLRLYRDLGYACKDTRFKDLYNKSNELSSK